MKKFFTLFAAVAMSLAAWANDYTGTIAVSINGEGSSQETTITVDQNEDGTYKLSIYNFTLVLPETVMPVGNIVVDNLIGYTIAGKTTVVANQAVMIEAGDDPNVEMWYGPALSEELNEELGLGGVPIIMAAQFDETNAKVDIDIDLRAVLEQFINVTFTTPVEEALKGDVNKDGYVTSADVTAIYDILLGTENQ